MKCEKEGIFSKIANENSEGGNREAIEVTETNRKLNNNIESCQTMTEFDNQKDQKITIIKKISQKEEEIVQLDNIKENKIAPLKANAKVDPPKKSTGKTQQSKNIVNVESSETVIAPETPLPLIRRAGEGLNTIDEEKVLGTKDEEKILLEKEFKDHKCQYFTCFFVIGIINFTGFAVILTASQDLAKLFGYSDQMPLFTVSVILSGILMQMANSRWFLKVNHKFKSRLVAFGFTLGYLLMIASLQFHSKNPKECHDGWGFIIMLIGALVYGISCALSNCTMYGFMKVFPSKVISGYVSGTGMAGIFGSV